MTTGDTTAVRHQISPATNSGAQEKDAFGLGTSRASCARDHGFRCDLSYNAHCCCAVAGEHEVIVKLAVL
jgi:hypothetical protein